MRSKFVGTYVFGGPRGRAIILNFLNLFPVRMEKDFRFLVFDPRKAFGQIWTLIKDNISKNASFVLDITLKMESQIDDIR